MMQTYLLGYEFPSTLMLLTKRKVYFVVSSTKGASSFLHSRPRSPQADHLDSSAKLLGPIMTAPASAGEDKVEVEILTRTKDDAENKKLFQRILDVIGSEVSLLRWLGEAT